MKRKLTSILLMSALLVGGTSTFVSCKDYDGDQAAVTNAELAKLKGVVESNYETLNNAINGKQDYLGDQVNADLQKLHETIQKADKASEWVEANKDLEQLKAKVEALATLAEDQETLHKLAGMTATWGEDFENVVVRAELANYVSWDDMQEKVWPAAEALFEKKEDMVNDVTKIIDDITKANAENFTSYADLVAAFDKVPAELQRLDEELRKLLSWTENIQITLDNMVTGVNVDMVENPYFGTLNTPFGIKSTTLIGFVGGEISNKQVEDFGGDFKAGLANSADGGTVYFTVNPSNIDATGLDFYLVGRDGSEAPGFKIEGLEKDNKKVTTIGTRSAGENNGAYKATAGIIDAQAAKVTANKEDLKKVAKNVLGKLKGQEGLDVTNAVRTIYSTFANAIPQYYALQAEYKVKDKDGKEVQKYYTSEYNIAAVTVQPLAYTTNLGAVGAKVDIPQIPLLNDVLGVYISDLKFDPINTEKLAKVEVSIPNVNDVKIDLKDPTKGAGTATWDLSSGKGTISINFDNLKVVEGEKTTVEVELDELVNVVNQLNGDLQDINTLIGKVQDVMNKADKYIGKVNTLIGKVNKFIDNANQYLQPIMIAGTNDNAFRLSEVPGVPSRFYSNGDNAIVLMPTSYTLELLAPAYKKSVKVNGTELNPSLDGGVKTVTATLNDGRNTIEYKTMDFYGNVVSKTYYVEVVKK